VDYSTVRAVIQAAERGNSPVIIQTSVKTVNYYGYTPIVNWVKHLADNAEVPVALHLDHCKDLEVIRRCIEAGWSSVMIDASLSPFEENVRITREVVDMAKKYNVTVEGELGAIVGVEDDIFVDEDESYLADPESCVRYIEATGIDVLAPAIGTAHGLYKKKPNLNFDLLKNIAERTNIPIAIHGGTGLTEEMFKKCIENGACKINISTDLKHVFRTSIEAFYKENPGEYEPLKVLAHMEKGIENLITSYINVFGSAEKTEKGV
jgi:ketose-bisphosphate aldolase